MNDEAELYWRMYQENTNQGRHHETQRATVTTILASVAAATLAFMRPNTLPLSNGYLPFAIFLIIIGIFGAVVTRKQYERFTLHMRRAAGYRDAIETIYPGARLKEIKRAVDGRHEQEFGWLSRVSLSWLWVGVHVGIAATGLLLVGLIVLRIK